MIILSYLLHWCNYQDIQDSHLKIWASHQPWFISGSVPVQSLLMNSVVSSHLNYMLYQYWTPFHSIPCDSSSVWLQIRFSLHSFTVVKVSCSLTYCLYRVLSSYHSTREISLFLSILFGSQTNFHTRTTVRFANPTVFGAIWPSRKTFQ